MCIGEEGRIILFFSFISYRIVTILLLLSTYVYRLYILYIYVCVYLFFLLFFFFLQTTCRLFSRGSRGFSNSLLEKRGSHSRQNILLVEGLSLFYSFFPFFFFFLSFFLFFSPFFVTNQRRVKASQTIGH